MPRAEDKILFLDPKAEGLDSDTDLQFMPPGHSPVDTDRGQYGRMNCRSGRTSGNDGSIENILGTEQVTTSVVYNGSTYVTGSFTLPVGNNKCIGWAKDVENNGIIWFNWSQLGVHGIYRYLADQDGVETIIENSILGFDEDYRIDRAVIIGDYLIWTDNNAPIRYIHIKAMINRENIALNPLYVRVYSEEFQYPPILTSQDISLINYPPPVFDFIALGSDFNTSYNNLRGKIYKFGLVYRYFDYSRSPMSVPSKLQLPVNDELINGNWKDGDYGTFYGASLNNYVGLQFDTGKEIVSAIEIYVKEGDLGEWVLYDTLEKYDEDWAYVIDPITGTSKYPSNSTISYRFYNDKFGIVADQENIIRLYDNVPQKGRSLELVDESRLVVSSPTLGYNPVDIDMSLRYTDVLKNDIIPFTAANIIPEPTPIYTAIQRIELPDIGDVNIGDVIVLHVQASTARNSSVGGNWFNFTYTINTTTTYPLNAVQSFNEQITNTTGSTMFSQYYPLSPYWVIFEDRLVGGAYVAWRPFAASGFQYTAHNKYRTFKKGQFISLGIGYKDTEGRWGGVNIKEDLTISKSTHNNWVDTTTVYSPSNTESNPSVGDEYQRAVEFQINHAPPDWATEYQIYISPRPYSYLKIYVDMFVQDLAVYTDKILVSTLLATQNTRNENPKNILPDYVWTKGDRIRFLTEPINPLTNSLNYVTEYFDFEIEGVATGTTDGEYEGFLVIPYFDYETPNIGRYSLVEIYSPITTVDTEDRVWYTMGEVGSIGLDAGNNRVHLRIRSDDTPSTSQDFDSNPIVPCTGRLEGFGDYIRGRYTKLGEFIIEDSSYSDFYTSEVTDAGKINAVLPDVTQKEFGTMLIHGGRLLLDTQINQLPNFNLSGNTLLLLERYGSINAIKFRGYELIVLQESKTTSIYINRNIITNADGSTQLIFTNNVFSSTYPRLQDWGTQNPESVVLHEGNIYFWDMNAGKYIRDAGNKLFPISQYYMDTYFKGIAETFKVQRTVGSVMITPTSSFVPAYFNERYDELHINIQLALNINDPLAIGTVDTTSTETLYFSEPYNRWKSFEYAAINNTSPSTVLLFDYFASNNITSMAWLNGVPYVLEAGTDYGSFFGTTRAQQIAVVSNTKSPTETKVAESISLDTNNITYNSSDPTQNWNADVYVPANSEYADGMESEINAKQFIIRENKLHANFRRNKNSKMAGSDKYKLVNGERLRGNAVEVTLENSSTDKVILSEVEIRSRLSKPS